MPTGGFESEIILEKRIENIDESSTDKVIEEILNLNPFPEIITLRGDVGAGKTSLVKKLVKALGSNDEVNSPTFSLVNEYLTSKGKQIIHSDWYRVKDIDELYSSGIGEYPGNAELMIVEWPETGEELLDGFSRLDIEIRHKGNSRDYILNLI